MTRPAIEVGCGFHSVQSTHARPKRHSYLFREAIEEARRAEELGFDSIWIGSHHFSYDGYCPSPIPALAHIAAGTSRIAVGSGILLFALHTPEEISRQCEAFHDALPDRQLRLAVASGYVVREFLGHRVPFRARGRIMDRNVDELLDKHAARFGDTELWMGGSSQRVFQRAARHGASLLLGEQFQPDQIREIRRLWEAELVPRANQRPRVVVLREVWPENDPRVREWFYQRLRQSYQVYELFAEPDERVEDKPAFQVKGAKAESFLDHMASLAVIDSADKIVDHLGQLLEAGADGFAFRVRVDGTSHGQVITNFERIMASVMPQLRKI